MCVQGFLCIYGRSVQALCLPVGYNPFNWFTRFPHKESPILNLVKIFTPFVWLLVFISLILVVVFLKISCKIGQVHGLKSKPVEILLFPARCILFFMENMPFFTKITCHGL